MSNSSVEAGARSNNVQTAIASFVGMAVAIPVSLMIFSATQPANAMRDDMASSNDKNYALYAQAFTQGFVTSANQESSGLGDVSCEDVTAKEDHDNGGGMGNVGGGFGSIDRNGDGDVSDSELVTHISNSYNDYVTNNVDNRDSNNNTQTVVTVAHSNGAVVTAGTSSSGDVKNKVEVENEHSNNTENKDSFNTVNSNNTKDSHNETNQETDVDIEDSFNKETTIEVDKSHNVDDSFNKDTEIDVELELEVEQATAPHNNNVQS